MQTLTTAFFVDLYKTKKERKTTDWKKSKFGIILYASQFWIGRDTEIYNFYNHYLFIFYTIAPNLLMLRIRTSLFSVNSTTEKSQIIFNYTHFWGKILSALILKNIVNDTLHSSISKYCFRLYMHMYDAFVYC